jgi:hypothetical protein
LLLHAAKPYLLPMLLPTAFYRFRSTASCYFPLLLLQCPLLPPAVSSTCNADCLPSIAL